MIPETNATLNQTAAIIDDIHAFGSSCVGCQKTGADIMIAGQVREDPRRDGNPSFYDLFLTTEQAQFLHAALGKVLGK